MGGTGKSATPGNNSEETNLEARNEQDEVLFNAYKSNPESFNRDATTRRDKARVKLRDETGMTDEAIEGVSTKGFCNSLILTQRLFSASRDSVSCFTYNLISNSCFKIITKKAMLISNSGA